LVRLSHLQGNGRQVKCLPFFVPQNWKQDQQTASLQADFYLTDCYNLSVATTE